MAQKKITDLQLRSDFDETCNIPVDDAAQTWRTTGAQLLAFVGSAANVITGKTEDTAPDPVADFLLTYDASGTALKKILMGRAKTLKVQSKTTTYTALITDDVILCDTSGGAWTLTLPAAATSGGKRYFVKKTESSANALTIDGNSSETIDGATTTTLDTENESIEIVCDGSNWQIVNRRLPKGIWGQWRHLTDSSWARSNTAYGDFTADSSSTFSEDKNIGMGTVTSALSGSDKLPGIVFTPKKLGTYRVTAGFSMDGGGTLVSFRLTDGTNVLDEFGSSLNLRHQVKFDGLIEVTSLSAITCRIEGKAATGTVTIGSNGPVNAIVWKIEKVG